MTDTGPEPDSSDTPANEPGDGTPEPTITSPVEEPQRDPFEEQTVDEELVDDEAEDLGDAGDVAGS